MDIRQSSIKTWAKCPVMFRYEQIDKADRLQSGSLTFGTLIHDCVLRMETSKDLEATLAYFDAAWRDPEGVMGSEYRIHYYVKGTNWKKYADQGPALLRNWWRIIEWDTDVVIAREHSFRVPFRGLAQGHHGVGTVDKVVLRNTGTGPQIVLPDYKTNSKVPTYEYVEEDLQFTMYAYATTCPEFWTGIENGMALYERYKDVPRRGEWIALTAPRRLDAGPRTERHYQRLFMAADGIARSIEANAFVPNISGESCRYCDYRRQCGLPELTGT